MKLKLFFVLVVGLLATRSSIAQPDGSLLWSYDLGAPARLTSPAMDTDGLLYMPGKSNLLCLDRGGNIQWQVPFVASSPYLSNSTPVIGSNVVYVANGYLNAFDLAGQFKWKYYFDSSVSVMPAVGAEGELYCGQFAKLLKASPSGEIIWTRRRFGGPDEYVVIGLDGTVYTSGIATNIFAFNPDGSTKWATESEGTFSFRPSIGAEGGLYGAVGNSLLALSPDGTTNWAYTLSGELRMPPAIGSYGVLYFGTYGGHFYAIYPNGIKKWEFSAGGSIRGAAAVAADGTIYFGCDDGKLYALKSGDTNATLKWTFQTGGKVCSAPLIDTNGVVYFGADDGRLYAVQGSSPLARSAWPVYQHDPQHTGRVSEAVVSAPSLSAVAAGSGGVQLTVDAEMNQSLTVQGSANLVDWVTLTNYVNANAVMRVVVAGEGVRFYRVIAP